MYVCTDPSRQIFKYKDISGELKKDVEAKKLTNAQISEYMKLSGSRKTFHL